jgi:hypothetical protein
MPWQQHRPLDLLLRRLGAEASVAETLGLDHLLSVKRRSSIMRYSIAAAGLGAALAFGSATFAADNGMRTGENGYGYDHETNGVATGWATQNNGYGSYHESDAGSAKWGNAKNANGYYHERNGSATLPGVQLR